MAGQAPVFVAAGLVLIGLLVAGTFGLAAVAGEDPTAGPTVPDDDPALWITVELDADGDAHWTIAYRFSVGSEEEADAFAGLADAVRAGEVDLPLTAATMEGYLAAASGTVDRDMAIEDPVWVDAVEDGVGTLALELTWRGFAHTAEGTLRVGDAFRSPDGAWLQTLEEGVRLTIVPPADHPLESVPPNATVEGDTVTWDGPHTFAPGDLELRYDAPATPVWPVAPWLVAILLLVIVATALGIGYRRGWPIPGMPPADAATADADEPPPELDADLLSDPERVERLLYDNGGRMKQAAIVEETGWSSAKVSQLLSEMADEGRVDKLRIGQENLISLPRPDDDGDRAP